MPRRSRARSAAAFLARVYRVNLTPAFARALLARAVCPSIAADRIETAHPLADGEEGCCVLCMGGARFGNICINCIGGWDLYDFQSGTEEYVHLSERCVAFLRRRAEGPEGRRERARVAREREVARALAAMATPAPLPYEEWEHTRRYLRV